MEQEETEEPEKHFHCFAFGQSEVLNQPHSFAMHSWLTFFKMLNLLSFPRLPPVQKSSRTSFKTVIPAQAGISPHDSDRTWLDPRLRGDDARRF
jgi:hypothetical protein